jgi:L-asparaginase
MIRIITTGGTIDGLDYDIDSTQTENAVSLIPTFLEKARISTPYNLDTAFSKDSRFITEEDRDLIRDIILDAMEEKILLTHGTVTMVETAKYLGQLNLDKTIVLVGAFVLGTLPNTDAPFNLGFALASLRTLDHGVYIAMQGTIFTWDNVVKNTELDRFEKLFI